MAPEEPWLSVSLLPTCTTGPSLGIFNAREAWTPEEDDGCRAVRRRLAGLRSCVLTTRTLRLDPVESPNSLSPKAYSRLERRIASWNPLMIRPKVWLRGHLQQMGQSSVLKRSLT